MPVMTSRLRFVLVAAGLGTLVIVAAVVIGSRQIEPRLHEAVVSTLASSLEGTVELGAARLTFFPLRFRAEALTVRHHGRMDVPPLLVIQSVVADLTPRNIWSRTIDHVAIDGMEVNIPPRQGSGPRVPMSNRDTAGDSEGGSSSVVIRRLTATNSRLTVIPRESGKNPKVWDIFSLVMHDITPGAPATFEASITNPIPYGNIEATGHLGPWQAGEPGDTPLDGTYTFAADLGTIKGLEGHVDAKGEMNGVLEQIATHGETSTERFRLTRLRGGSLPLKTRYEAMVDGTNGDVELTNVDVLLGLSTFRAQGKVEGTKGIKGKRVVLTVRSEAVDVSDLLRFLTNPKTPAARGTLIVDAAFDLLQGTEDVLERLALDGSFRAERLRFTDPGTQEKVDSLSRRAQGRPTDLTIDEMASRMRSAFTLRRGILTFKALAFDVEGASVRLAGTYALEPGTLAFTGEVRLAAPVSKTQTGFKTWLLKPLDPLFRNKGAGTLLAIKVHGTPDKPEIDLDLGKTLKRK